MPIHWRDEIKSFMINHEKIAVKTGIRFTKTLAFATPILRTTHAKRTNAITDAKTDNIMSENNPSEVGANVLIFVPSNRSSVEKKYNKPNRL